MTTKKVQVDSELTKAFRELQAKVRETKQKIKIADKEIQQLHHVKAHSVLTQSEILNLNPDNRMYLGVGRMFLCADMNTVLAKVKERYDKAEEKIKTLENSKDYLERSVKDSENNLREMIQEMKDRDEL